MTIAATLSAHRVPSPSLGPPLLSASWSPAFSWAMPWMTVGGGGAAIGGVVAGGVVVRARVGAVIGGVVAGGVVVRARAGTVVGGVVAGGVVGGVVVVVVVVVVLGVWAAGLGLVVAALELDMSPIPRARPPATRAAITAMRIPSRLVNWRPLKVVEGGCGVFAAAISPPELSYVGGGAGVHSATSRVGR